MMDKAYRESGEEPDEADTEEELVSTCFSVYTAPFHLL